VTNQDPFEDYKKRREIELMEHEFQEGASQKRELIENLLNESGEVEQLEERVTDEMEDFLAESTRTAERMLDKLHEEGPTGQADEELKQDLQSFIAGAQAPEPAPAELPPLGLQAAQPSSPPALPAGEAVPQALDLRGALARIRQHGGTELPPMQASTLASPAVPPEEESARTRDEILHSFDATYQQVSDLLNRKIEDPPGEAPGVLPGLAEPVRHDTPHGAPTASAAPAAPAAARPAAAPAPSADPLADPFAGGGGDAGGMASTNAFEADPEEDRDIDDPLPGEVPEGWDLPDHKPPPGAWVVAKQKEEGEAGMAGMAGDTYLLKKLSQEVRRLNRVYLVLLEKKVVTREEVEGPGANGSAIAVDSGSAPKADSADDDDDDVVGVDDYDEERYRPILTNENDFSLSTLVKDVHRLKTLKTVHLKKGVVSEKEMAKVKG